MYILDSVFFSFSFIQDYFSSCEMGQSADGEKTGEPREKKHLAHSQAKHGLSHMCPIRSSGAPTHTFDMIKSVNEIRAPNHSASGAVRYFFDRSSLSTDSRRFKKSIFQFWVKKMCTMYWLTVSGEFIQKLCGYDI